MPYPAGFVPWKDRLIAITGVPLTEMETFVLWHRYSDAPKTLEMIGAMLGLTRERTRQIESNAIMKLARQYCVDMTEPSLP